jgi:GT2 family glycosyltransferase
VARRVPHAPDLAVIVVSHGDADWLTACLGSVYARAGGARLEVVVVSNLPGDGTREVVEARFPQARVLECENHGFAHGNNRGLLATRAPYVLFLNPDTEIIDGTLGELVAALAERPGVGLAGVRQVDAEGRLHHTIRRFPNAARALADALATERWPVVRGVGEREMAVAA